ncbi:MAG: thioredoxin 1 [Sulfurimonas sp.]|jgi:thioredoxin 1|uniref:thioredoxin n=1 Tax=Sulfurimonas sp. TaxID=2022749 RepID=UPI0039E32C91
MAYIDLTTKSFDETLDNNEIVIIDFWAEWCGPCKQFAPIFEKVAENNPDITFAKVNTEEQQALSGKYGVRSIPTLMVVRDGIILLNQGGMLPEKGMNDLIAHIKGLDMDKIRKEMEEEDDE